MDYERQFRRPDVADKRLQTELRAIFGRRCVVEPPTISFPVSLSHFELSNELGTGARGTVYLARDRRLNRLVAVKILHTRLQGNQESRQRFRREAICASAINHPNIVTVYELGRDQGTDFIVMEYVLGETLNRLIPKRGLPIQTCIRYGFQIALALSAVHSRGMVHRDLKPANFVVKEDGTVKLLDFGLAKLVRDTRRCQLQNKPPDTCEGTILGTVGYMSPEQVRGTTADRRSDIFSFGAILYELLTGRPAFQERTPIETMNAILHKEPPKLPSRIPKPVGAVVRRSLQKLPNRRYKSATELVSALLRACTEPPGHRIATGVGTGRRAEAVR
jgi:serine/threonine protein kinase